jgi:hypothetical protein
MESIVSHEKNKRIYILKKNIREINNIKTKEKQTKPKLRLYETRREYVNLTFNNMQIPHIRHLLGL